jgi:transcriptional regulator with XRE-family HTH domain
MSLDIGPHAEVWMNEAGAHIGAQIRRLRKAKDWTVAQLAVYADMSPSAVSQIETGRRSPTAASMAKLAGALEVEVRDLFPLAQAPLPDFEDERRAVWEAAVDEAQRLREAGEAQMWKALSGWRASKQRGEPYATRRKYLDEMGNLLQEVYDADVTLQGAYIEAALTQGGSEASGPNYLREESRTTGHFYGGLLRLVESVGLSVRTGDDAAAAKRAAKVQPETRPLRVEEPEAA